MIRKLVLMVSLMPFASMATTWYVNGSSGSDYNSGTSESSAKATIQAAIDASSADDTILVAPGTYNERLEISRRIEVKAISGPQDTTIHGQSGYAVVRIMEDASGTVVDGFEITGGTGEPNPSSYGYDYYGGGVRCRTSATIRNCIIHGNGHGTPRTNSGTFGGGISSVSGSVLVENCLFYDNFAWACGGATFVECSDGEMILSNCTIYNNDSTNFFGYQGGVGLANGATVRVKNCIVWGNGGSQIDAYSCPYNSDTTAEVAYSCIQGGVAKENVAVLNSGAGNISGNPNFIDAANGDYRLAAGSPCIDAGDNSYVTGDKDLAGNARIANGTVDIGCYEYGAASVGGTTWYVNGSTGSDANSGTSESSAKATIQAAIDAATEGDTILVAPGTYAPITTGNKAITIRSTSSFADTIIDAAGTGTRCVLGAFEGFCYGRDDSDICTNSVIIGFTLQNGDWPLTYGGGDGGCVLGGTYKSCRLLKGTASGGGNAGQAVLENCFLKDGTAYNGGNVCGCIVRNCTLVDGNALHNGSAYYNCAVYNSICIGAGYQVGSWDWPPLIDAIGGQISNVYDGDPSFVDAANGDYRLAAGSPCIDAGNNSYVTGDKDLAGNARIANGTVDIGCYEYDSTTALRGSWQTGTWNDGTWQSADVNLIAGLSPYSRTGNFSCETADVPSRLTNGSVSSYDIDGYFEIWDNSSLTYCLNSATSISEIRLYAAWRDSARNGISVSSIETSLDGVNWTTLPGSEIYVSSSSACRNYAFFRADDECLVSSARYVRINFGTHDWSYTGYAEIEVLSSGASFTHALPVLNCGLVEY